MTEAPGGGTGERSRRQLLTTPGPVRFWSPALVLGGVGVSLAMVIAGLGGIYDPAVGYGDGPVAGWAFATAWVVVGLRASVLGVTARRDRLRVRNWWRTYELRVVDIDRVETDFYDGFLTGGRSLHWLRVVRLRVGTRWVTAWGLTSRAGRALELARLLEAVCGVPPTPQARPRTGR